MTWILFNYSIRWVESNAVDAITKQFDVIERQQINANATKWFYLPQTVVEQIDF